MAPSPRSGAVATQTHGSVSCCFHSGQSGNVTRFLVVSDVPRMFRNAGRATTGLRCRLGSRRGRGARTGAPALHDQPHQFVDDRITADTGAPLEYRFFLDVTGHVEDKPSRARWHESRRSRLRPRSWVPTRSRVEERGAVFRKARHEARTSPSFAGIEPYKPVARSKRSNASSDCRTHQAGVERESARCVASGDRGRAQAVERIHFYPKRCSRAGRSSPPSSAWIRPRSCSATARTSSSS